MKQMKQQEMVIAAVAIVVLIIAGLVAWKNTKHEQMEEPQQPAAGGSGVVQDSSLHEGLTYTQAVNKYGVTNYRIQFLNCRGTPGLLTMKTGTKYMLDNRDNKAHTIVIAGASYKLGAYGFAIVSAAPLGQTHLTCDGGGAADILVQK